MIFKQKDYDVSTKFVFMLQRNNKIYLLAYFICIQTFFLLNINFTNWNSSDRVFVNYSSSSKGRFEFARCF